MAGDLRLGSSRLRLKTASVVEICDQSSQLGVGVKMYSGKKLIQNVIASCLRCYMFKLKLLRRRFIY